MHSHMRTIHTQTQVLSLALQSVPPPPRLTVLDKLLNIAAVAVSYWLIYRGIMWVGRSPYSVGITGMQVHMD